MIYPFILLGTCLIPVIWFNLRIGTNKYYSSGYVNAFPKFTGVLAHTTAVICGGIIGTELLNFHEASIPRAIRRSTRILGVFGIMYLMYLGYWFNDKLSLLAPVFSIFSILSLFSIQLISSSQVSVSKWNMKFIGKFTLVTFFSNFMMLYIHYNRQNKLNQHINKEIMYNEKVQ